MPASSNDNATNMVAEPGSGSTGPGLPTAALNPENPTFGPFFPGGSSPGRWSQVQALGNFTNQLARKLEEWATEIGLWKRNTESRIAPLETETGRIAHDITGMKEVVEAEFARGRVELTTLATQSRESITTLGNQTRTEIQNFQAGVMGEVGNTRATLHNLRNEASGAVNLLASSIESSKAEHQLCEPRRNG